MTAGAVSFWWWLCVPSAEQNTHRAAEAAAATAARVERALQILGDRVSEDLAEAGRLRLEHRSATLEELGQLAVPALSKDAMAGRIRRLLEKADRYAYAHGLADTESVVALQAGAWTALCCILLALCNMGTVYLRNVPADVIERLERLAARERVSVNTYAMRELAEAARRADNADLLAALPDLSVDTDDIVAAVGEGRSGR